jgi:hypothetical protein
MLSMSTKTDMPRTPIRTPIRTNVVRTHIHVQCRPVGQAYKRGMISVILRTHAYNARFGRQIIEQCPRKSYQVITCLYGRIIKAFLVTFVEILGKAFIHKSMWTAHYICLSSFILSHSVHVKIWDGTSKK